MSVTMLKNSARVLGIFYFLVLESNHLSYPWSKSLDKGWAGKI